MQTASGSPARKASRLLSSGEGERQRQPGSLGTASRSPVDLALNSPPRTRKGRVVEAEQSMRSTGTRPAWDVGDYVEKKFRTADHRGNAWFRGMITGQSRQSHHLLPPGSDPENMVKVHWLNGDPPENVDVSSARIRMLGKRESPPPPVRTREEEREIFEEQREGSFKDPHFAARQRDKVIVGSIVDRVTDIVIDAAIESATAPLADGSDKAASLLQEALLNHLRRRPLLQKWKWYLRHGDLDLDCACSELSTAVRHVKSATGRAQRRKLPSASLVSPTELRDINQVDPETVSSQDDGSFELASSLRLLSTAATLTAEVGNLMRPGFHSHIGMTRTATRARFGRIPLGAKTVRACYGP